MEKPPLYHYRANVVSVYDGDTCTVDIDLGLGVWLRGERIRLMRINAPEIRGRERRKGVISRDYLRELILGKSVFIQTIKDRKGKYGRYLGEIWSEDETGQLVNINDQMVKAEMAEYREY